MRRSPLVVASLTAAFLAFHLVAVTLCALPAPDAALNRAAWSDPTVQEELAGWQARLGFRDPKRFQDGLYALAARAVSVRNALVAPFARYYDHLGTFQSWQMFVAPHRHPARLRIDVEERGRWRTVFRESDPAARWLARELDDTRFRSVIFRLAWPGYRDDRERFADLLARRAARDFPGAGRLRMVFSRAESPTPEQARRGEEPPSVDDAPIVRELGALR